MAQHEIALQVGSPLVADEPMWDVATESPNDFAAVHASGNEDPLPDDDAVPDAETLRHAIQTSLQSQGFIVGDRTIELPAEISKDTLRRLHEAATQYRIARARPYLARYESRFLTRFMAAGDIIDPSRIVPELVEVMPGSEEELLFRYACLHWSIPVSSGYGRRLRFLVMDRHHDRLIGLLGLGDPVFSIGPRDRWVGWTKARRGQMLHHVMDAFVLGAVPPYNRLLGGKLVAMLVVSAEVREAFRRKYEDRATLITRRRQTGDLALVTTTSALGRSSLYNRIRFRDRLLYIPVGFTQGTGEFHFSNALYEAMTTFASVHCAPTAKHQQWGTGFRNRRELVKKCLTALGLPRGWLHHGVARQVYVAPLGEGVAEYLRGDADAWIPYDYTAHELFRAFRERWLLPRAARDDGYRRFRPEQWRLWGD